MPNKMLIDATHPEETRVIVLRGNRVEEFDFESADRKQLRGNIYLAKVTRVEPSLQAAFVEYGGNRHGFLAFSEIHPDYYQIPVADRQALLEEEARAERDDENEEPRANGGRRRGRRRHSDAAKRRHEETVSETAPSHDGDGHEDEQAAGEPAETIESASDHPDNESHEAPPPAAVLVQAVEGQASEPSPIGTELQAPVAAAAPEPDQPEHTGTGADDSKSPRVEQAAVVETPTEPVADDRGLEAAANSADEAPTPTAVPSEMVGREMVGQEIVGHVPSAGAVPSSAAAERTIEAHDDTAAEDAPASVAREHSDDDAEDEREADDVDEDSKHGSRDDEDDGAEDEDDDDSETQQVEQVGGDAMEEVPYRPARPRRHYKIQEVIKRRQVLLVQVVKEERGTKGAALTTYLSLAGRYSVLMPNTARGGGISRKITDSADRKRLKSIAEELEVPEGMGIILRTAGASRTKPEVKRDFEYLLRMWETVREVTLQSTAPTLVYEEGSLIKRAIRDLYNKDVEEIVVAGEDGYKEAKEFMRLLMPSHAKNVQPYHEPQPIFSAAGAEAQLDGMYFNQVTLRSGGYIVINQTEALVAIDVNSGRSTREHNIEDTALRTNLEAADEVARQLRLRDLAGLIVVDFIDMEEGRNNRAVERRMKEALKNDRARIQIGRISHFGLLEMSRQRIRTGVLEGSTVACPHCMGTGMVRATASIALHVLRGLEEALIKNANYDMTVRTRTEVALYILNQKREHLRELEERFGVTITLAADPSLGGVTYFAIDRGEPAAQRAEARPPRDLVRVDSVRPIFDDADDEDRDEDADADDGEGDEGRGEEDEAGAAGSGEGPGGAEGGRRRRRRRRGGRDRASQPAPEPDAPQPSDEGLAVVMEIAGDQPSRRRDAMADAEESSDADAGRDGDEVSGDERVSPGRATSRRRRRSRRGGEPRRGNRRGLDGTDPESVDAEEGASANPGTSDSDEMEEHAAATVAHEPAATIHPPHDEHQLPPTADSPAPGPAGTDAPLMHGGGESGTLSPAPAQVPDGDGGALAAPNDPHAELPPPEDARPKIDIHANVASEDESPRPKRSGWWQRAKATFGG